MTQNTFQGLSGTLWRLKSPFHPQKIPTKNQKYTVFSRVAAKAIFSAKNYFTKIMFIFPKSQCFGPTFKAKIKSISLFFEKLFNF